MSEVPEPSSVENSVHLLVLDDEQSIRWVLKKTLARCGYSVHLARDTREAIEVLDRNSIRLALVDINLPDQNGISFTRKLLKKHPNLITFVMTGQGTMYNTIEAMKAGAFDFITKPFDIHQIIKLVREALKVPFVDELGSPEIKSRPPEDSLVGEGVSMRELFKSIGKVASADLTVMIHGESGTGKELIARTIHRHSKRVSQPFVAINCAAIPSELLESELFGHEKGAFTGAVERKRGKLEQASKGTLFLDEIGDMPLKLQSKLLRVLQEKQFERIGGQELISTDMRVIAATHRNLEQLIEQEKFRTDLYFRLNVFPLQIPPLRERMEDLPKLVEHFLNKGAREMLVGYKTMSKEAIVALGTYHWPGNVRELENILKSLMITNVTNIISSDSFPKHLLNGEGSSPEAHNLEELVQENLRLMVLQGVRAETRDLMQRVINQVERPLVQILLEETRWNQQKAARILGINRNTLRKKIEVLEIKKTAG